MRKTVWIAGIWLLAMGLALAAPQPLVQADKPVTVGVQVAGDVYRADLDIREACTVTLFCPVKATLLSFTGVTQPLTAAFDPKAQTLRLQLQPGKYTLTIRSL
jgi:hypothetical protein